MSCGIYVNFDIANLYSYRYAKDLSTETFTPNKNTFTVDSQTITPTKKFIIDSIVKGVENKFTLKFAEPQNFENVSFYYGNGYTAPFTATTNNFNIVSQTWNAFKTELTVIIKTVINMDSFSDRVLILISGDTPTPPPAPKYKVLITGTIQNASCNYANGEEIANDKNVTITANDGYYWDKTYYPLVIQPNDDNPVQFTISHDKKLLTFVIPENIAGNIELDSNYIAKHETTSHKVLITGTIRNATCNYANGEIIDTVNKPIITITALPGFTFTRRGYQLTVNHLTGEYFKYTRTVLSYDINSRPLETDIVLLDSYIANKPVIKVSEFNHLYAITTDELSKLAGERFVINESGIVDYGVYINSLYKLPFKISPDLLGEKEKIKLGVFASNTQSAIITKDVIEFDLPTISCTEKYKNVYDYKNVKAVLYAPFFQPIDLPIQYVMGCTLSTTMKLNLYTNKIAIFITSSFNNSIVHYEEIILGVAIPFVTAEWNYINAKDIVFNPNISNKMVLEISRKIPHTDNLKYHLTKVYNTLNKYKGFISVDNIELNSLATNAECAEIKTLLNQGIFINQ